MTPDLIVRGDYDGALLRRAVLGAVRQRPRGETCWQAVMRLLACGSTAAKSVCVRFALDPEEVKR